MIYYLSIIILLIITFVLIKFFNLKQKSADRLTFFIFILMLILAVFRKSTVGNDTPQFTNAYLIYGDSNGDFSQFRFEFGYSLLNHFLNKITPNPQILIIVTSLFIHISVYIFIIKNSEDKLLSLFLYFTMNIFFEYLSMMRQAISISILLIGYKHMKMKGLKHDIIFLLLIILAAQFHKISYIAILIIPLKYIKLDSFLHVIFFSAAFVLYLLLPTIVNTIIKIIPQYEYYLNSDFLTGNMFAALINLLIYLTFYCILLYENKYDKKYMINSGESAEKKFENELLFKILFLIIVVQILTMRYTLFTRINSMFLIYLIIIIPKLLNNLRKNREIIYFMVLTFMVMYFLIIFIFRPEWFGCNNYLFFFQ